MKIQELFCEVVRFPDVDVIVTSAAVGFIRLPVADYTYYENLNPRYVAYKTEVEESRGNTTTGDRLQGIVGIAEDGSGTPGGKPTNDWLYAWFDAPEKGWYTENKTLQSYLDAGYTFETIIKNNTTN